MDTQTGWHTTYWQSGYLELIKQQSIFVQQF